MKSRYTKSKIFWLFIFILFQISSLHAQEHEKTWQWTTSMGSTSWDFVNGIKTDTEGNLYIGGAYASDFSIGNKDLESKGNQDLFVAKYNSKGKLLWIWSGGGDQSDKLT